MSPSLSACNENAEHDYNEQFDGDDVVGTNGWSANNNYNNSNYYSISGGGGGSNNNRAKINLDEMLLQPEYPSMLLQDNLNITSPTLPSDV